MKLPVTCLIISVVWALEAFEDALDRDDYDILPLSNRNGWVNPEDLASMPQCIAQQDTAPWLDAMTRCTSKRCTSHFGVICTHHQWLTQLSCLSTSISSNLIRGYLPYCSRSILAKAQLHQWVRAISGRPWLADVGDTNDLESLSPRSLARGYKAFDVTHRAPACLADSASSNSAGSFQSITASCSFSSEGEHTGNAARPWEYSGSLRSLIPLDTETVGYDLTGRTISSGHYFDIKCFCSTYRLETEEEPCTDDAQLGMTKERLWMSAICGPSSLPRNWTAGLRTTDFAYIPIERWEWPDCVADMPREVTDLTKQCTTDACKVDSNGYCEVKRSIDRACFCHQINYDSCDGSCKVFESRIDYVRWLHDLCGEIQDWKGLPDDWTHLAAPTTLELLPWDWTLKSSMDPPTSPIAPKCASNAFKFGSFALINIATFFAAIISRKTDSAGISQKLEWKSRSENWFLTGLTLAGIQLLANLLNTFLVQDTLGYEHIPLLQLILLWCSMPRPTWMIVLLIRLRQHGVKDFSTAASFLFAELMLQILSLYPMATTVYYGMEHDLYFRDLNGSERGEVARLMYFGALAWLALIALALALLLRTSRSRRQQLQGYNRSTSITAEDVLHQLHEDCPLLQETLNRARNYYGSVNDHFPRSEGSRTVYGTDTTTPQHELVAYTTSSSEKLYVVLGVFMLPLWIAQGLFWSGFIALSSEEFCPPRLEVLTAIWIVIPLVAATWEHQKGRGESTLSPR